MCNICRQHMSQLIPSILRGYLYAGLEFGAECYCGHRIQAANMSDDECNMPCKGEKGKLCGGANRLSIYRLELSQESARRCEQLHTHTFRQASSCMHGRMCIYTHTCMHILHPYKLLCMPYNICLLFKQKAHPSQRKREIT